jgi:DNA gyrase/topoisomerase IV subunit B
MKERGWIEPIVERVVGQVLDSHTAQLRTEIVRRVMEEIVAEPVDEPVDELTAAGPTTAESPTHNAASASAAAELARAVAEIQLGTSQREILRALLDTSARYAARVALFVVKGSHATGWQARGFANSDAVKDFALDENAPAVLRVIGRAIGREIGDRAVASAPVADLDSRFLEEFGAPASGEGRILPLMLKDKVAALVYADSGTTAAGLLDAGSLELLVLSTSAWLEVNSLRKQAQKEPSAAHADSHHLDSRGGPAAEAPSYPAAHTVPLYHDPFASHAPEHAMAAAASAGEASASAATAAVEVPIPIPVPTAAAEGVTAEASAIVEVQSAAVEVDPALAEPLPSGHAETKSTPETAPVSSTSPEDQGVHRKAQRFARLLVDEIKLYNQAKVAEGRKNKDLYDRLKQAIEKSRGTYQKRYGNTVAASGNYFQHEIIRSLAEDDLSIMGANFRQ